MQGGPLEGLWKPEEGREGEVAVKLGGRLQDEVGGERKPKLMDVGRREEGSRRTAILKSQRSPLVLRRFRSEP